MHEISENTLAIANTFTCNKNTLRSQINVLLVSITIPHPHYLIPIPPPDMFIRYYGSLNMGFP